MTAVNGVLKLVGVFDEVGEISPTNNVFITAPIIFTQNYD